MSIIKNSPQPILKLVVLLAAGCITTMTGSILAPVFPEIVKDLQLAPQWAGMLISIHTITIAIFIPLLGIVADIIGKSKVLILSLFAYGLFGVLGAFLNHLTPLLITRGFLGIAAGGITASCISIISDIYQGEARLKMLGYATSAMTTATIFMPLLGGWVGSFHWRWVFYVYGLSIPVALFALLIFGAQAEHKTRKSTHVLSYQLLANLKKPSLIRLFLTIALSSAIMYSILIYAPVFLAENIRATSQINGIILATMAIGLAIFSAFGAIFLAKRMGHIRTIALGFILMAITLIIFPLLKDISLIILIVFIFGTGLGIVLPNVYNTLAELALPELRSSVLAIGSGFNSLGQFISPLILGFIWDQFGLIYIFSFSALIATIIGVYFFFQSDYTLQK